jgi:uroporphyrinogen-III synthase
MSSFARVRPESRYTTRYPNRTRTTTPHLTTTIHAATFSRSPSSKTAHKQGQATVRPCKSPSSPSPTTRAALDTNNIPDVVLTREAGKNGKLKKRLESLGLNTLEMPLLETSPGPDKKHLPIVLATETFDWVCLTSPESASVFLEGWKAANKPKVRIAVVGQGTAIILDKQQDDLKVDFAPSIANAEHFAPELPMLEGGNNQILYPASCKASSQLQKGLEKRGFIVKRLNTYDTLPVQSIDSTVLERASRAKVIAVASPSAVKAWTKFSSLGQQDNSTTTSNNNNKVAIACIGSTSAKAAHELGYSSIYWPNAPGLDGFVAAINDALCDAPVRQIN